jgi:crotonobetainyl-CoA:carnitine CoA-transferase CaiB-like acyl-CoA transferase
MTEQIGIAADLRVVEIGSSLSVAVAGMTLADAGADVVSIERPGGHPLRAEPAFAMWGRGKRAVELDLASSEGRAEALALMAEADVVLLGLKAASVDRLGLAEAAIAEVAPQAVQVSLTGFGPRGPYRDVPVYDAVMQARGGRMRDFSTLHDGARPAFAAAPIAAYGAAMALLAGTFGGLRERERNGGKGQRIETDMARALSSYDLVGWIPGGPPPLRTEDVPFLPYTVARTADGVWIQFAQNGPALFADFLRVLGLDGEIDYLSALQPVADNALKRAHRERVQAKIAEKTWSEWQAVFAPERNLSAEPFLSPGGALSHAQFEAIGDVIDLPDPSGRPTRQLGPIFDVPTRPLAPSGPAPGPASGPIGFAPRASDPPSAVSATEPGPGLLSGITVIELGMWIALPYAATQLAELGARVIKLEPLAGDPMRSTGPVGFKIVQGKESLALDLKRPEATEIVHRLVAKADAVLHSYRPGVPERLGIDFETLREINPRLVYLYNGSYGSRGPKSYAPAFHVTGGAVAGGAWAQAGTGCPPQPDAVLDDAERARVSRRLELANEANPDFNSAVTAAAAAVMGLYHVARTGEAIAIETRMMLSNAMMMSPDFVDYDGRPPRREVDAALDGFGPLYRLYPAAEGWVFLAAPEARDFARLCDVLGLEALAADPRFSTPEARADHAPALAEAIGAALAKRGADELEQVLTARGIGCMRADEGPYRSWLFEQDWALEQGVVVDIEASEAGPYRRYGAPLTNDRPVTLRGARPSGSESRALLEEVGFSSAEIDGLLAEGVIAQADE